MDIHRKRCRCTECKQSRHEKQMYDYDHNTLTREIETHRDRLNQNMKKFGELNKEIQKEQESIFDLELALKDMNKAQKDRYRVRNSMGLNKCPRREEWAKALDSGSSSDEYSQDPTDSDDSAGNEKSEDTLMEDDQPAPRRTSLTEKFQAVRDEAAKSKSSEKQNKRDRAALSADDTEDIPEPKRVKDASLTSSIRKPKASETNKRLLAALPSPADNEKRRHSHKNIVDLDNTVSASPSATVLQKENVPNPFWSPTVSSGSASQALAAKRLARRSMSVNNISTTAPAEEKGTKTDKHRERGSINVLSLMKEDANTNNRNPVVNQTTAAQDKPSQNKSSSQAAHGGNPESGRAASKTKKKMMQERAAHARLAKFACPAPAAGSVRRNSTTVTDASPKKKKKNTVVIDLSDDD